MKHRVIPRRSYVHLFSHKESWERKCTRLRRVQSGELISQSMHRVVTVLQGHQPPIVANLVGTEDRQVAARVPQILEEGAVVLAPRLRFHIVAKLRLS